MLKGCATGVRYEDGAFLTASFSPLPLFPLHLSAVQIVQTRHSQHLMSLPFLDGKIVIVLFVDILSQEKVSRAVMPHSDSLLIVDIHEIVTVGGYEILDRSNFVRGIEVLLKRVSKLFHGQGSHGCGDPCENKLGKVLLSLRYRVHNPRIQHDQPKQKHNKHTKSRL